MIRAYRVFLSGRVQGVGFRSWTKRLGESYGLEGWVRNLPDGRVEVFVQGHEDVVQSFVWKLWEGPEGARVDKMEIIKEVASHEEKGFYIKY
ncbi:acylphosphatase [Thermocrinis sp.]|uniref:acylphosphatase n=1 Tax=Thermocrinis sp. TaxID=2024383 RepID=UPI002FDD1A7E